MAQEFLGDGAFRSDAVAHLPKQEFRLVQQGASQPLHGWLLLPMPGTSEVLGDGFP